MCGVRRLASSIRAESPPKHAPEVRLADLGHHGKLPIIEGTLIRAEPCSRTWPRAFQLFASVKPRASEHAEILRRHPGWSSFMKLLGRDR